MGPDATVMLGQADTPLWAKTLVLSLTDLDVHAFLGDLSPETPGRSILATGLVLS